jgi:hypothetical protein
MRLVNLRATERCARCRRRLYAGDCVSWEPASRTAHCEVCAPYPVSPRDAMMEPCPAPRRSTMSAPSR